MKPASVIRRWPDFVTLRTTTDEPAEIRDALEAHEVLDVYKGDQNQAWDAVLANHCLARAVGNDSVTVSFFVQDEKLGTPDSYLAPTWRAAGRKYALTEDYFRYRKGAVWEHQDVSYGLFFTEVVTPEQFASAAAHLHRAAQLWKEHAPALAENAPLRGALNALGVSLDWRRSDAATGLGAPAERDTLAAVFAEHADVGLYYALTKSAGLYGVVPVDNDDVTLSSIPATHPEMRRLGGELLRLAARGAIRSLGTAALRRAVAGRARTLAAWADGWLDAHPRASVTDFQAALGGCLTREIFPSDRLSLDRASHFTRVPEPGADLDEDEGFFFFLDLCLRYPQEFTGAYNEALNRVGFGLQRMKCDPLTGRFTPPFFVTYAPDGPGTPVYRYGLELSGVERTTVQLTHRRGGITLETAGLIQSAADLIATLRERLDPRAGLGIVGKAAPFAAELKRQPRSLGLPRQGSKYNPMVDLLLAGLRARGVLEQADGVLIRIGLDTLDRLEAMGATPLRLPAFLAGALGETATCQAVAQRWRGVAEEARRMLDLLAACEFGQHVHLAKIVAANCQGRDWRAAAAADSRLARLTAVLQSLPDGAALLDRFGADVAPEVGELIDRLTARRQALLAERRRLRDQTPPAVERERAEIECQLLLLHAAYVRRLWQRAESLAYVNDRPYTLALYLMFGPDVFPAICRRVEFDLEYPCRCVPEL